MSKFVFSENMYGRKVKFLSDEAHMDMPEFYPAVGTVGIVVESYDNYEQRKDWKVQWPKGSTSRDDCWFCDEENVELIEEVDKQMTNEEIWEMLQPKLLKNYIFPNNVPEAVGMAYRVGYLRAMKNRPFKIGKKKKSGHWEPIKESQTIPLKGRVRYSRHNKIADNFQVPIGATGEIRLVDALDHSTMLFTVYLDEMVESTYTQWLIGVPAHCYDMWVEDGE